ncbi:MAG: hypothetical protein ACE5H4_10975 [Candidatus Thorarchaeota archaeon]
MSEESKYVPGEKNIGKAELDMRKKMMWGALIVSLVLFVLLVWLRLHPVWRLTLALPVLVTAAGFFEGLYGFCPFFGLKSRYNFEELGKFEVVTDQEAIRKDRAKASKIILYSLAIGLLIGIIAFFLPI